MKRETARGKEREREGNKEGNWWRKEGESEISVGNRKRGER